MRKTTEQKSFFYMFLLYLCGFFLFLEWLYPLGDITDTTGLSIFVFYAVFCFLISIFQIRWWVSFLLKGLGMLVALNLLFAGPGFLSPEWFSLVLQDVAHNLTALFGREWYALTPLFRSGLFLLLIWLMSYLLHYWFVVMKRVLLFVLLTFVYLTVLDTFTIYDGGMAIVRIFFLSFIALGMANLMKELNSESLRLQKMRKNPIWILPLISMVLFSTLVGFAAPKFSPQWPDPVPFIKSTAENAGNFEGGVQKVGYGEDDSQLGGSFVQDYTPVFEAVAEDDHYWHIESKDVYTGKGWETSAPPDYNQLDDFNWELTRTFLPSVETEAREAHVEFMGESSINKLVHPYGIYSASTLSEADFFYDVVSNSIQTRINNEVVSLDNYTITYEQPTFSLTDLREAGNNDPFLDDKYTRLPDIPDRVGELAEEITDAFDTRYEKVKAVEQYFGTNGYAYQTTDVPIPEEDEDYVDQFLFESKVGYCDNYSTSMVVLLRSLDIPARWAKGFTSGEVKNFNIGRNGDQDLYEVTNANAHSWVEVYFPEIGWVPFEPTQGFSNPTDFQTEMNNNDELDQETAPETPEQQEEQEQPEQDVEEEDETAASASNDNDNSFFQFNWIFFTVVAVVLGILLILGYRKRFRWQAKLVATKLDRTDGPQGFQDAYHFLIKLLNHHGVQKQPDQTLREYAQQVDNAYHTDDMKKLTSRYEQMLYQKEYSHVQGRDLTQLWKDLIKRILG
ncbi:Protein-glutamine gamma-glutamyltransferase [Oceanobacillus picturae]|uniref:Protein-glutamine gamma-glutamyltransferase n=1 Tax=Oceanobacillus picturae TaxID=171693 RepID=W9ANK2_9BACI|nr:transglutaminase domain-containing protein [Oceanobacillus picturae]CDO04201.1 Protein-glutamine gamma-glutamyltransferase [Oceanobacillus picturae]